MQSSARARQSALPRILLGIVLLIAGALLLRDAAMFAGIGIRVLGFPGELDYGEGIVWQQAILIAAGHGYGSISGIPAIVFHYPPVYHLLVMLTARVADISPLVAGRFLSLLATPALALLVGCITSFAVGGKAKRLCGIIAALVVPGLAPVQAWAPLMRVDMVATALSFAGFTIGLCALSRPKLIVVSALCFTAAIYTKQTQIAAPAALFLLLLLIRPRLAAAGIAVSITLGLATLAGLGLLTDGGFLRHVFLYNINRFDASRFGWILIIVALHALYFIIVAISQRREIAALAARSRAQGPGLGGLRRQLAACPEDTALVAILLYFLMSTAMLITVTKSGSSINYFIEWLCVLAMLVGLSCRGAAEYVTGTSDAALTRGLIWLAPLAVGIQAWMLTPKGGLDGVMAPARLAALNILSGEVRDARLPVISDDMVLLLSSGKSVIWEPAIFAELASTKIWDERPLVRMIHDHRFAFFITQGDRGNSLYDSRYNPAIAAAMAEAYPIKIKRAGYVVHYPPAVPTR